MSHLVYLIIFLISFLKGSVTSSKDKSFTLQVFISPRLVWENFDLKGWLPGGKELSGLTAEVW